MVVYLWNTLLSDLPSPSTDPVRSSEHDASVFAADRDLGAIAATKANAERAGVINFMDVRHAPISSHPIWENEELSFLMPRSSLLVATNPPYGKRVSKRAGESSQPERHLLPLYQTLGNKIKDLSSKGKAVSSVLLVNSMPLVQGAGLAIKSLFKTTHGGLPVAAVKHDPKQITN